MRSARSRPSHVGRARAHLVARRIGDELRLARLTAGLTQEQVARAAGISQTRVSRVERGILPAGIGTLCLVAAAVGHELSCRIYPIDGLAVRDAGQLRMAGLIAASLHPAWRAALEVPVGTGPNERRAIDQVLDHPAELVAVEIERWIVDFQAQLRSGHLKRDALAAISDRPVRFLLVLRDAPQSRRALRARAPLIARSFPIPPREAWRALRSGQPIGGDGLLLVRERELRSVPA